MHDEFLDFFIVWKPAVAAIAAGSIVVGDEGLMDELYSYPDGSVQFAREQLPRMDAAWAAAGRLGFSFEQNTRWRSLAPWGQMGFGLLITEEHFMRLGGECGILISPASCSAVAEEEYELSAVGVKVVFRRRRPRARWTGAEAVEASAGAINQAFTEQGRQIRLASDVTEGPRALEFSVDLTRADQMSLNALILFALGWGDGTAPVHEVRLAGI